MIVTATGSGTSCSSATFTINSIADATTLSQCSTLVGDVHINAEYEHAIQLSGPASITGDLRLDNAILISFKSDSLQTIGGTLAVNNVTALSTLALGNLTSVGSLQMNFVPALSEFNFDHGITSAKSVSIANTSLSSLDGLAFTQIGDFTIARNLRLNLIDLPLVNSTGIFTLIDNGQAMKVNLPDLTTANELYISNVTQISLPTLQTISGTWNVDTNYFTELSAPVLQSCGDGLSIVNNAELDNFILPQLSTVTRTFLVANNSKLYVIGGLNDLSSVSNDIEFRGNFYA